MKLKKVTYALYIFIIIFLIGYGVYHEFFDWKLGNFIEKDIVAAKVDSKILRGGGIIYSIVDGQNNTYFFRTTEISEIIDNYPVRFGESSVTIKYNVKNNEILEVSNGFKTEKRKLIKWWLITIWLIIAATIIFVIYLASLRIARFDKL